jgi:hypothetical protein
MVGDERLQDEQQDGMHTMEETDMLATKLGLLIKCLDKHSAIKGATYGIVQSPYSHIPCEMCRNFGHLGNDYLETQVDMWYNNYNGSCP